MSMNHITYFKFKSPYEDDITKNCALSGAEVDSNFFTLESRDIKSIKVSEDDLILTLFNGNEIKAEHALEDFTKGLTFEFDSEKGELIIKQNGVSQTIEGFITKDNYSEFINSLDPITYTDQTINGNGKKESPLSISNQYKTGKYKPVDRFIDAKNENSLPPISELNIGERILTLESIDTYGYLYDFNGANSINIALNSEENGWRVPSKEDWDDMLNAIESVDHRNHTEIINGDLGAIAGKILKSKEGWQPSDNITSGIDKLLMNILPCGYIDGFGNYQHNNKVGWFWTLTKTDNGSVFTKRFENNKSTVYQETVPSNLKLSIRLVKDFDGDNFYEYEDILGIKYHTILLPSLDGKYKIWTAENILDDAYKPYKPILELKDIKVEKYFINEWDGELWSRKELKEGESVVIKNTELSLDGEKNQEFIITDGKLVCISKNLYNKVLDEVEPKFNAIDTHLSELDSKTDSIKTDIRRIDGETQQNKASIIENTNKLNDIESELASEISNRGNSEKIINENINSLNKKTDDSNEVIAKNTDSINRIDSEVTEAKSIIKSNTDKIGVVESNLNDNIKTANTNKSNIEKEISDRKLEGQTLTNNIDTLNNKTEDLDKNSIMNNGSIFNPETGKLTLKTKSDEVKDLEIQFSFNFGDF